MVKSRVRMRQWLVQKVESAEFPGLRWYDDMKTSVQIPWKHGSSADWSVEDCDVFRAWALYTGKNRNDPKRWKANFRCALNSLTGAKRIKGLGQNKGCGAKFAVYELLPFDDRKTAFYQQPQSIATTMEDKMFDEDSSSSQIHQSRLRSESAVRVDQTGNDRPMRDVIKSRAIRRDIVTKSRISPTATKRSRKNQKEMLSNRKGFRTTRNKNGKVTKSSSFLVTEQFTPSPPARFPEDTATLKDSAFSFSSHPALDQNGFPAQPLTPPVEKTDKMHLVPHPVIPTVVNEMDTDDEIEDLEVTSFHDMNHNLTPSVMKNVNITLLLQLPDNYNCLQLFSKQRALNVVSSIHNRRLETEYDIPPEHIIEEILDLPTEELEKQAFKNFLIEGEDEDLFEEIGCTS